MIKSNAPISYYITILDIAGDETSLKHVIAINLPSPAATVLHLDDCSNTIRELRYFIAAKSLVQDFGLKSRQYRLLVCNVGLTHRLQFAYAWVELRRRVFYRRAQMNGHLAHYQLMELTRCTLQASDYPHNKCVTVD